MIVIMKVGPDEFFNDKMSKLLKNVKILMQLENKKTYNTGMMQVLEMSCGGRVSFL